MSVATVVRGISRPFARQPKWHPLPAGGLDRLEACPTEEGDNQGRLRQSQADPLPPGVGGWALHSKRCTLARLRYKHLSAIEASPRRNPWPQATELIAFFMNVPSVSPPSRSIVPINSTP